MCRSLGIQGKSFHYLTSPPSRARMKAQVSLVQERAVSVLPSLNRRVIQDSYVKQNLFWSWNKKKENSHSKDISNNLKFTLEMAKCNITFAFMEPKEQTDFIKRYTSTCSITTKYVPLQREEYPVVGQLKRNLNKGIRVDSTLLDLWFAEVSEDDNVHVHIVSKGLGHCQRLGDLLLTLRETKPNNECRVYGSTTTE